MKFTIADYILSNSAYLSETLLIILNSYENSKMGIFFENYSERYTLSKQLLKETATRTQHTHNFVQDTVEFSCFPFISHIMWVRVTNRVGQKQNKNIQQLWRIKTF